MSGECWRPLRDGQALEQSPICEGDTCTLTPSAHTAAATDWALRPEPAGLPGGSNPGMLGRQSPPTALTVV